MKKHLSLLLLLLCLAPPAAAEEGSGHGRWGYVPARSDSLTASFAADGAPLWEKAVDLPWKVVTVPLGWLHQQAGEGLDAFLTSNVGLWLRETLRPKDVPLGVSFSPSIGGLDRLALQATFFHNHVFHDDHRLRLAYKVGDEKSRKAYYGGAWGKALDWGVGWKLRGNARYYGLGPSTRPGDISVYTEELSWAGLGWTRPLGRSATLTLHLSTTGVATRGPVRGDDEEDDPRSGEYRPALEDRYAGALPTGYGEASVGWSADLDLRRDTTTGTARPQGGGVERLRGGWFQATRGEGGSFLSVRGEVERYLPLGSPWRTLALRGTASWIEAVDGAPAFQRLYFNDDPDLLRGYSDFRWRDRGLLLLNAEYRFPAWALDDPDGTGVDLYLLADVGQVFGDAEQIALRNLRDSYGFGFRILTGRGFLARLELAWSEEDFQLRLKGEQLFQSFRDIFFHGERPTPLR